ncbi:MAG: hypothetical protein O7G86_16495 [Gammaproteobacteria bacterium]|nr:hypothetical protein [Gammaproteobacteria bacterium]MCZ6855510.1 hypothetical protein [Gammaproteobacteria bacterium]
MIPKYLVIACALVLLSGCGNIDNAQSIRLGDVSVGQQMIDLKRALEEDAITADEHAELKQALMSLSSLCGDPDNDES